MSAEIEAVLAQVSRGYAQRDPALASAVYLQDDDFVLYDLMPPFADPGWPALARKNEDFIRLTEGPTDLHWTDTHVEISADLAYFRGIAHFSTRYVDGRPMEGMFRHTVVLRRAGDGWGIIHEHSSQPNPALDMPGHD